MSNQGFFEPGLLDTASRVANDTSARLTFFLIADNKKIASVANLTDIDTRRVAASLFSLRDESGLNGLPILNLDHPGGCVRGGNDGNGSW